MKFLQYRMLFACVPLLMMSCTQSKVTSYVTKSPELPVDNIQSIAIGKFTDELGKTISPPKQAGKSSGKRGIATFVSNQRNADLMRSLLISELSKGGDYRILNSSGGKQNYSGAIPDAATVGVINARVKYYEYEKKSNDQQFFVLMVTNNGAVRKMTPIEQLGVAGLKLAAARGAERLKKGFRIAVPYVERIAALEVEFDLLRKSDGRKIVPTQTVTNYFRKKWGGNANSSILAANIKKAIQNHYNVEEELLPKLLDEAAKMALQLRDEEEYVAKGYFLRQNPHVPLLPLDLRQIMAQRIAGAYAKKIGRYHQEVSLSIASGDSIGVTLMKGNAYDKAIGHLESLRKPLDPDDTYNLALAYESIGERPQALRYYEEGYRKSKEKRFQKGIGRTKR